MEPNQDMMINEEIEQAKQEIGTMTNLWFYTKILIIPIKN